MITEVLVHDGRHPSLLGSEEQLSSSLYHTGTSAGVYWVPDPLHHIFKSFGHLQEVEVPKQKQVKPPKNRKPWGLFDYF